MELLQYIRLFRRWAWLIVLLVVVAAGASFIISNRRPPAYKAETMIAIGRFIDAPNPNNADIQTGINLALTYAQLVTTHDILQGTIDTLKLSLTADDLQKLVSTRILTGTSLLVIGATYPDPVTAATIADQLAEQLILNSPTNLTPNQQAQIDFANDQVTALNAQLESSRTQLALIDDQLQNSHDSATTDRLNGQHNALVDQINQTSATIAQFSNTITTLQERTNAIDIVEHAQIPTTTTGPGTLLTSLLGATVGLVLGFSIALLIEYLDDRIRTTEDAAQLLMLPVLGGITRFGKKNDPYPKRLVTELPERSAVAEGYRTVRTNLIFSENDEGKGVFVVTSANPAEGKSVTVANLAVIMAQAGLRVLLIDCDMRRPTLHEIFGLKNEVGLTTLLGVKLERLHYQEGKIPRVFQKCVQSTSIERLVVMTSGQVPHNPTELLGSTALRAWIDIFRKSTDFDVVLMDTPPGLAVPDSAVLAASTKADVIMVVDCGHTRHGAAQKATQQMSDLGIKIRGVVVNRTNLREESYSYSYSYRNSHYYKLEPNGTKGLREKISSDHE
jgi:tyrosine-protein kinase